MTGLAKIPTAALFDVLGSIAATVSKLRVRIAVGFTIVALVATASLPPPLAMAASVSEQVEHRAWNLPLEEWSALCKRFEQGGKYSVRPETGSSAHWCYLSPTDGSEAGAPHPVVLISFHATAEDAKAVQTQLHAAATPVRDHQRLERGRRHTQCSLRRGRRHHRQPGRRHQ